MIDDKKLEKMLRRQVRTGLTIYVGGDEIAFVGSSQMVRTTLARLQDKLRVTLGALVEMLGFIPEEGAILIRKTKDGYDVQEEMLNVVSNQIGTFLDMELIPVKRTGLSYGWAWSLWQTAQGRLYGQTSERVDTGGSDAWLNGAGCLVLRDLNCAEEQYIKVSRPEADVDTVRFVLWRHLEQVMWTEWPETAASEPEDDGQISLDMEETEEESEETDDE